MQGTDARSGTRLQRLPTTREMERGRRGGDEGGIKEEKKLRGATGNEGLPGSHTKTAPAGLGVPTGTSGSNDASAARAPTRPTARGTGFGAARVSAGASAPCTLRIPRCDEHPGEQAPVKPTPLSDSHRSRPLSQRWPSPLPPHLNSRCARNTARASNVTHSTRSSSDRAIRGTHAARQTPRAIRVDAIFWGSLEAAGVPGGTPFATTAASKLRSSCAPMKWHPIFLGSCFPNSSFALNFSDLRNAVQSAVRDGSRRMRSGGVL